MKSINNKDFFNIYIVLATLLLGIVFLGLLLGSDINYAYFWGSSSDTFMDYFNCIAGASFKVSYQGSNIYPPICWIIFNICRLLSGNVNSIVEEENGKRVMLKMYQMPMMLFTMLLMLAFLIIYVLISEVWNYEKGKKQWAIFLLMLSVPFLYVIERGNILILSFIGTLAFFAMKDSEKRWVRDIGYLALAVAAAIKVYPAIFGFVLVKEKRYKEALRLALYGIVVFGVPFLFVCNEGLEGIFLFFKNILGFNSSYVDTVVSQVAQESGTIGKVKEAMDTYVMDGGRIGYAAFMEHLFMGIGFSIGTAVIVADKVAMILSCVAFLMAFLTKKKWQVILLLASVLAGFQSRSYVYTAIFLVIPFLYFIKEEKRSRLNIVYFILLMLILFPLPFGWTEHLHEHHYYIEHRSFNTLQIGGAIWGITVVCIIDTLYHWVKSHLASGR